MEKQCPIVEDLLPLYNEDLLKPETKKWIEAHLQECKQCQALLTLSQEPLPTDSIQSSLEENEMFKKINRKLAIYQMVFVGLSLILAMTTSLVNGGFHFILTYPILGLVTFLFYKDIKLVFYLATIPLFIWSIAVDISDYTNGYFIEETTITEMISDITLNSIFATFVHLPFALIGALIGFLILKLTGGGDQHDDEEKINL
ncbi:hypothetical protein HNQ35_001318 [Cerasibacillus quisquiliarum]|uniref:Putative zinc-finger domain-containing protein n=1 Tax=Cerasibacillus quisquiliarum TaxID=227865 RepID=A0A511V0J4_9BACI|nr:zf-HC2 domain-containing protein [Cerasibacillus quisquiliarum]MBB5146117.1 hypothetical protein [Cerasibacillus quisquiliarum]GEN30852.1 hypothetical protein CQU01_10900 [Cerasibacillus quisquiliarum]